MEECDLLTKKILALFQINEEIIEHMEESEGFQQTSYKLVQQSAPSGRPSFQIQAVNEQIDPQKVLSKPISVEITPHLFSPCQTTAVIKGFAQIKEENQIQKEIADKYAQFGQNSLAARQLIRTLHNFEAIQVGLGEYQRHLIQKQDLNLPHLQNQLEGINETFKSIFQSPIFSLSSPQLALPFEESSILSPVFYKNLKLKLSEWIHNKSTKLLYGASANGWDTKMFHELCDGKGPTLTVAIDKQANIFGGFTSCSWHSDESYEFDSEAFLFSLQRITRKSSAAKPSIPSPKLASSTSSQSSESDSIFSSSQSSSSIASPSDSFSQSSSSIVSSPSDSSSSHTSPSISLKNSLENNFQEEIKHQPDSPRKFPVKNGQTAIDCRPNFGPEFGNGADLRIFTKWSGETSYERIGYSYENTTEEEFPLTGAHVIELLDYEVFLIGE